MFRVFSAPPPAVMFRVAPPAAVAQLLGRKCGLSSMRRRGLGFSTAPRAAGGLRPAEASSSEQLEVCDPVRLSSEQLEAYEQNGFLVVPNVLSVQDIEELRRASTELQSYGVERFGASSEGTASGSAGTTPENVAPGDSPQTGNFNDMWSPRGNMFILRTELVNRLACRIWEWRRSDNLSTSGEGGRPRVPFPGHLPSHVGYTHHIKEHDFDFSPTDGQLRRLLRTFKHSTIREKMHRNPRVLDCVEQVLNYGRARQLGYSSQDEFLTQHKTLGVRFQGDKVNLKLAHGGAALYWHHDWSFTPLTNDSLLAVGVPLETMNAENGGLSFVPGSHKDAVGFTHRDLDDERATGGCYSRFRGVIMPEQAGFAE